MPDDPLTFFQQRLSDLRQRPDLSTEQVLALADDLMTLLEAQAASPTLVAYSDQMLRAILDHSGDGIVVTDEHGRIVGWNQKQTEITGLPREAALGRWLWDVQFQLAPPEKASPEQYAYIKQMAQALLRTGVGVRPVYTDVMIRRTDGRARLIQSSPVPVATEHGFLLISTLRDVTDQRQIEEDLHRSEERYRTLFEQANDAIFLEDEQDNIIDANQQACRLMGYTREELLRLKVRDLQAPEARRAVDSVVADELRLHAGQPFEGLNIRKDGMRVPVEIMETRLTGRDAGLVLTIVRDITERRQADRALRESEEQFRLAFSAAAIGKAIVAINGRFLQVNSALCAMLGYTEADLLGKTFSDITYADDVALGEDFFRRVLAGEFDTVSFEKRYLCKDGTPLWISVSSSLIRNAQGQPRHFISEMQDINERKLAETALQESEEKYRQLFELESDALFLIDNVTGQIYDANAAATTLYGFSRDELLSMRNTDLSAEPDQTREAMRTRRTLVLTRWHHKRNDEVFPVEITARHLTWRGRPVHIAAIRDITERLQAEQAIVDSEQRYRALVETSPDAIILINPDGTINLCNQRAADLLGVSRCDSLISRSVFELVQSVEQARARTEFENLLQTGVTRSIEYIAQNRQGRLFPVEITSSLVYDAQHQPAAVVSVVRDITERKQAETLMQEHNRELAQLNRELQARNEDLDAFAHTVAHDLKNPLHLIIGFAEAFIESASQLDPDIATALTQIARGGRKMNNIIDELLLLAGVRRVEVTMQPIDLAQTLHDALQRLADLLHDAQVSVQSPATWPVAIGYGPWVEEIWVNYLSNAIKYGGRPPVVEVGADLLPNGSVRCWVRDNGDGIPPEVQPRLFTPFTRFDQVRARGYGLGLSIVRRIAEKMGGQVGLVSSGVPGQGSLFFFNLPPHAADRS